MKVKELIMKRLVIILALVVSAGFVFGQNQKEDSTLTKKERKQAEMQQRYLETKYMLENNSFVIETDYLSDRYGNRVPVSSTINFVMVDDSTGVIQIGSNHRLGANGVGGVTAKGEITQYELTEDEDNKSFYLHMRVMTAIGIYDLGINVSGYGNATARLTGLRAGQLTFAGDIKPLEESIVYEGYSL
jgi:hypothetical protein